MKNQYARYPLVMSCLALACFFAVAAFMASAVQPPWGRILVLLIPAITLYVVTFLSSKGILTSKVTTVITTILSIVLLLASVFYTVLLSIWASTTVTTDVRFYSRAYARIDDEDGVEGIFPEKIPTDANDITFKYTPQFLQGGEVFELSCTLSSTDISEWESLLKREAEWIGSNEEWHKMNNWAFRGTNGVRYQLDWDGGYNHGEMSYVLIEPSTNRITFYYSEW